MNDNENPLPMLEGIYDTESGLGDALASLAIIFQSARSDEVRVVRVTVTEVTR